MAQTNVLSLPGNYSVRATNGYIELIATTTALIEAPTSTTVDSPDTYFLGNIDVQDNTILGIDNTKTIDANAQFISDLIPRDTATYDLGDSDHTWNKINVEEGEFYSPNNTGNPYGRAYDPGDVYGTESQRQEAAVYLAGGMGIEKDLNVGGYIYGRIEYANTTTFVNVTSTNINQDLYLAFVNETDEESPVFVDITGIGNGLRYNPSTGKITTDRVLVAEVDDSTSETTGALQVAGGVGVVKNVYVGEDLTAANVLTQADSTGSIGLAEEQWADGFIQNLYTKIIRSTTGTVQIDPAAGLTEIIGDIRVRGNNPVGTAPVVTNTLYVTMDGNDTNDGRAQDSARACRTIGGALNSPYYQPGTQILVSAGFYLEDNPLRMKPYTSIRGSDIRTTFIEPINKTQDLFHVDSGCYLNYMTFLNGRSGLLEGPYEQGFNRGAYATAFPPSTGEDRIDLFHSPYIQNCTNQSGPWLKDGTMFVPNQTVQVPQAVGTGTWAANTTSIVVTVGEGVVSQGMTINAGQQNLGFFDARTLMLANKPFLQEQVVAYVDQTFNSGFTYDQVKCFRDIGFIVDSIALDLRQSSESESIFAGLQYWNQNGYVDAIDGQITTTSNAINFLKGLAVSTATTFGNAETGAVVGARFDKILEILNTSTTGGTFQNWISGSIVANGTATSTSTYVNAYDALILAKEALADQVIGWIGGTGFTSFSTATCRRDVGYLIDSVAFDLLHGGNKQSIKSGVYYFDYVDTSTNIVNEVPQTVAAYNFIRSLVSDVVLATPVITTYQGTFTQVTAYNSATIYEVELLQDKIDVITNIIRNGPSEITTGTRIPINLETSGAVGVLNAYELLQLNRQFIQHETIAYINQTFGTFDYSREKCFRDVGILVENISYDASFGGNQKAVESGLAYYDGVISRISGQETQTISAIDYLNNLSQQIIVNNTVTDLLSGTGTYAQVFNPSITGGGIASDSINDLFNIITTIINDGPNAAPVIYTSTGPDAAYVAAQTLMEANRKFIQQDTINWINNTFLSFPYSEIKCRRDTGLIIDAVTQDMLYPTSSHSQSTFAGLQYWNQNNYVGDIEDQLTPTVDAITYLKELSTKIIQNVTPADDLVARYQSTITQVTNLTPATSVEIDVIEPLYDVILEILNGNKLGWTDRIVPNTTASNLLSTNNGFELLQANKNYLGHEVTAYVNAVNPGLVYDIDKCRRDVGYMVDAISFDLLHGGNRQTIQNGLYYYGFNTSTSVISHQSTQTVAAFNYLSTLMQNVVQNVLITATYQTQSGQNISLTTATAFEAQVLANAISTITSIISSGPSVAAGPSGIALTASTTGTVLNAVEIINANKQFLIDEVISFIDSTYNPLSFNYDEAKCFRDVGLIVDAVSQDILLGGNQKSIEAGLAYWSGGYNSVVGQETTTTMALNHARDVALKVIANVPVVPQTGTVIQQIINPFFQYGGDYMPQQAVARNFGIITKIIQDGPIYAPPIYAGGGLFSLTGINGADVKIAPTVTEVTTITTGTYLIGLSTATIGFGTNATLYFGDTLIFPLREAEVEARSYEYTGNTSTWALRKVDPIGSMGGSLVDGSVISDRSPIQSFVYDAFTQVTQGGRGVHIINDGYAQLVSVFTVFCSTGVEVESGGIASIVNSNANFGNICLQARGYGKRKFSGTVYNPPFLAWDSNTNTREPDLDQYFPNGFWPNNAKALIFCPDIDDRPHISLVMEVVPPEGHTNEQGFPGFLNASPTTSTITTGTITITGVDTDGIAVGNSVYIRDQYGKTTSTVYDPVIGWVPYVQSGTVVTDIGYKSITLNKALSSGGGDVENPNFFDFYFCGNAYYTVLSSEVSVNPKPNGVNILSTASTGLTVSQVPAHIAAIRHLNTITNQIIANSVVTSLQTSTSTTQVINPLVLGGAQAQQFIDLRFQEMIDIISTGTVTQAEAVIPPRLRTTSGPPVQGAGSAVTLLTENIEFIADEMSAYAEQWAIINEPSLIFTDFIRQKCQRDAKIILQRLIYDIETGGRYNSVMVGLSYWSRNGTHHTVQLGENVTRTDLFPDGATVNFYQRSYMSASGYVFEYVGAGIDYGALPQRGVADPVQSKEVVQLDSGKVFFTSTDQNGDFRIGPGLVISQATGVLSGRTFTKSLFANMTPFILAVEGLG
jgi:CTP:phosphocholine cytidylyltransferase-like protein